MITYLLSTAVLLGVVIATETGPEHPLVRCFTQIITDSSFAARAVLVDVAPNRFDNGNIRKEGNTFLFDVPPNHFDTANSSPKKANTILVDVAPSRFVKGNTMPKEVTKIRFVRDNVERLLEIIQAFHVSVFTTNNWNKTVLYLTDTWNETGWNGPPTEKAMTVLLVVESEEVASRLQGRLDALTKHPAWISRALCVVAVSGAHRSPRPEDLPREVLQTLRDTRVSDALVLTERDGAIDIYTWFPYSSAYQCGKLVQDVVHVNTWVPLDGGKFLKDAPLITSKVPSNLHGCVLKANTFVFAPFIISGNKSSTSPGSLEEHPHYIISNKRNYVGGLEIEILNSIAKYSNGRINYNSETTPNDWGGLCQDVISEDADVCFAGMLGGFPDFFEESMSYHTDGLSWFVPCAQPMPRWRSIIQVFNPGLWLTILISYILTSVSSFGIDRMEYYTTISGKVEGKGVISSFFSSFAVLLGVGLTRYPTHLFPRSFLLLWVLCCLVISASYQSSLVSFLSNPGVLKPIQTVDELIESGISIYILPAIVPLIRSTYGENARYNQTLAGYKDCVDPAACLHSIAFSRDRALACSQSYVVYDIPRRYSAGGRSLLYRLREDIRPFRVTMSLPLGSALVPVFDRVILRLMEAGAVHKWWRDLLSPPGGGAVAEQGRGGGQDARTVLTPSHLQGAFFLLGLGSILASAVLLAEIHLHARSPKL